MKCNKCDTELVEGARFCTMCGCKVEPAQELVEETVSIDELVSDEETVAVEDTAASSEEPETAKDAAPVVEGKLSAGKIALLVTLVVAAIAVVVALVVSSLGGNDVKDPADEPTTEAIVTTETTENTESTDAPETTEATEATIPPDGNPDDVTCKGSYTATDDEVVAARDTVVATLGDEELTIGELQVYYWDQFYQFMEGCTTYASYMGMDALTMAVEYMGLDYTQPLDTQISVSGEYTWQQEFLNSAIQVWHAQAALTMQAEEAGWELEEEYVQYLNDLSKSLEDNAVNYGFENAQAMLEADMGKGVTIEAYAQFTKKSCISGLYYSDLCDQIEVTDDEVEAYFDENAASYTESGLEKNDEEIYVDARHILVMPKGGTTDENGTTTYSEAEWEACREAAQAILDEWKAGNATEATFAALANERSEDGGSNTNGGLYEDISVGQMVEPFETWCFDQSRQYGDTGLVKTNYGYHVMYFVDSNPVWYSTAKSDMIEKMQLQIREDAMAAYELNVDYSAIILSTVNLIREG